MSLTRKKPMSRGTKPMSRGKGFSGGAGFAAKPMRACATASSEEAREARLQERAARAAANAAANAEIGVRAGVRPIFTELVQQHAKQEHLSNEKYRRIGASFECINCSKQGRSQFAHANEGKGIALKTDDRTGFPLCGPELMDEGCHTKFDQYRLVEGGRDAHRALAVKWGAMTRKRIFDAGLWPAPLPVWRD